jgi:outer membrane protein W
MKRALVILIVAVMVLASVSAKSRNDSLRFGFEGGFGKNETNAVTPEEEARDINIKDNGFYADALLEYHFNDDIALKISGGVQYQRKAEVKVGDSDSYKLDEKTGLTVEASVLLRYAFYRYDGFGLYASIGAEGIMSKIGPESETYSKDDLTNIGFGVAAELGTEIEVAYKTFFTLGVKGAYIFYDSTNLLKGDDAPLKTMSMFLVRPYVGFAYRIY